VKRFYTIILVLSNLFGFSQTDSCTFILDGTIHTDIEEPTNSLQIVLLNAQKGARIAADGSFLINDICKGNYILQIRCFGETVQENEITIQSDTSLSLLLDYHIHNLKEFEVIIDENEQNTFIKNGLTPKQLNQTRGLSLGGMLEEINGVRTLKTGNSIAKPIIHGLHSNRVLILNNSIRQEGQQWGAEHAPEIDPFVSNSISVVKGANSIKYGFDAIGGVILVEPTRGAKTAGTYGEVNLVGLSNGRQGAVSGSMHTRLKKLAALSLSLQGSLKRGGNQHTPSYYLNNSGIKETNFSTLVNWEKENYGVELFYSQFNTDLGIFSGSHIGNLTDLQNAFNLEKPLGEDKFSYEIDRPRQRIEHELSKVSMYFKTGDIGKLNLVYGRQYNLRYEYDKDQSLNDSIANLNRPDLQLELTTHTVDINWKHFAKKGFSGEIGLNSIYQKNTYTGRMFVPNFENQGAGLFWIERKTIKKLLLEGGLRVDYRRLQSFFWENDEIQSPTNEYLDWAFNIGGRYSINNFSSIRFNVAKTWRPPSINELYSDGLHHGAAAVEIGDANLNQEDALNTSIEYDLNYKWLRVNVQPYFNYFRNHIFLEPQLPPTLTIKGAFPTFIFKETEARIYGVDFFAEAQINKVFSYVINVSLLRGYNISLNDHLLQMPADNLKNRLNISLPQCKGLTHNEFSIQHSFVAEQSRVPENSDFIAPPNAYNLFDLTLSSEITTPYSSVNVSIGVHNLFNTRYRDYLNRFRYYADELGRNISVRIKIPINQ